MPLPANEVSSSVLVASYSNTSMPNVKGTTGGGKPGINGEIEKGLLTLISSDSPGLQVPFSYCTTCCITYLCFICCCIKRWVFLQTEKEAYDL